MPYAALRFIAVQVGIQIATYLYYALLARTLEPNEVSHYITLTACVSVYSVLGIAVQQFAAKSALKPIIISRRVFITALWIGIFCIPLLQFFVHIAWFWTLALTCCIPCYMALSAWRGVQLAHGNVQLEHNFLIEHGSKFLITPFLFLFLAPLQAAAFAIPASLLLAWVHARFLTKWQVTQYVGLAPSNPFFISSLWQLLSSNLDVLMAQALLEPSQAILYTHAALLARVMLFFGQALIQAHTKQLLERRFFVIPLGLVLLLCGVFYVFSIGVFGQFVWFFIYGQQPDSTGLWVVLVVAATMFSLGGLWCKHICYMAKTKWHGLG